MKRVFRSVISIVIIAFSLIYIANAFAQPNNRVSAGVSDTYMTFPDGDIVAYEPLDSSMVV